MQALEISLYVNVALIALLLFFVQPKISNWYSKQIKQRETQKNNKIKKIVRDYLKELQK